MGLLAGSQPDCVLGLLVYAQDQHWKPRVERAKLREQIEPVPIRKIQIEDQDVDAHGTELVERLARRRRLRGNRDV